jgi:hypothetical protein
VAAVAAGGVLLAGSAALAQGMALPGKLDVSDTGAATYSIPVVVPPGLAGATPSLSLEYNSQAGDGILGIGWSLAGIPAVTRCNRTLDQDGYVRDVRFDAQDAFCLSGQRLIPISGENGTNGTEYRTEIDGFSRIISYGTAGTGPQSFKVWTKAGLILEFGATADSRVPLNASSTTARAWALDRQEDQYGNYLTATYTPSAANGQAYLARIDYSGNSTAGVAPANSVRFTYEARTDNAILYHAGYLTRTPQRLTTIDTYDGANLVSKYKLAYEYGPANNVSRLTSVTLCDAAGTCLPATSFTWNANSFGWGDKTLLADATAWASDTTYGFADFNNDGIQDLWYIPSGTTQFNVRLGTFNGKMEPAQNWSNGNVGGRSRGVADLNGDGMADKRWLGKTGHWG